MPITLNGTTGVTYPDGVLQGSGVPTASATSGAPLVSNGTIYTQNTAVTVAFGGTGATTLTGVLKGNGTSAFTAAVAGTDFVSPGGALGTPSSGTLTNCTGYSASNLASGTLPAARLPAGSVLQVIQTVKTDAFTTTSGSYVDVTGYSANITPTSSSNRILIFGAWYGNNTNGGMSSIWLRNATQLPTGTAQTNPVASSSGMAYNPGGSTLQPMTFIYLDSPATTSAITYKMQTRSGGGTSYINTTQNNEYAAISTIILMEIAG